MEIFTLDYRVSAVGELKVHEKRCFQDVVYCMTGKLTFWPIFPHNSNTIFIDICNIL